MFSTKDENQTTDAPKEDASTSDTPAASAAMTPIIADSSAVTEPDEAPVPEAAPPPVLTIPTITTPKSTAPTDSNPALSKIKQQALEQLSPIIDQIDQTPEEKFHTVMMMVQASDNQDLIQKAYDTAQQITDEKARAHALLGIVNEIDYFTQNDTTKTTS